MGVFLSIIKSNIIKYELKVHYILYSILAKILYNYSFNQIIIITLFLSIYKVNDFIF